ncbi:MAG: DUF5723 family protein, partial [Bacteroidota bacterium]
QVFNFFYSIFLLLPFYSLSQDFNVLAPIMPNGVTRINTQPADIISDNKTFDAAFTGMEAYFSGNIIKYSTKNLLAFHQNPSYNYNELERISVYLPAISIPLSEKASLGGTAFYRHQTSIKSLGADLGNDIITEFSDSDKYNQLRSQQSGSAVLLNYYGGNITYARVLSKLRRGRVNGGISVLGLLGTSSAYTQIHHLKYTVPRSSVVAIRDYHLELGGSVRLNDMNNDQWLWLPDRSLGLGTNLGISWNRGKNYAQHGDLKVSKVSLAILNLGFIRFNRGTNNFRAIGRDQKIALDLDNTFGNTVSINSIHDSLDIHLDAQQQTGHYKIGLPTSAVIETLFTRMDWRLFTSLHIDISTTLGYRYFLSSMSRLNVVPAWQGRYISVGLPVTLSLEGGIQAGTFLQAGIVSLGMTLSTLQPEGSRQAGFFLLLHLPNKKFQNPQSTCKHPFSR